MTRLLTWTVNIGISLLLAISFVAIATVYVWAVVRTAQYVWRMLP
jgi:hypothetical protein